MPGCKGEFKNELYKTSFWPVFGETSWVWRFIEAGTVFLWLLCPFIFYERSVFHFELLFPCSVCRTGKMAGFSLGEQCPFLLCPGLQKWVLVQDLAVWFQSWSLSSLQDVHQLKEKKKGINLVFGEKSRFTAGFSSFLSLGVFLLSN